MDESSKHKWVEKPQPSNEVLEKIKNNFQVNSFIAKLLYHTGLTNFQKTKDFFNPSIKNLHHPMLMKDMDKAISLLHKNILEGNKVLIYGDYDVDGTTSVTLLYEYLSKYVKKSNLLYYIPDRSTEGYGLSDLGIQKTIDEKVSLLITVDCGIKSVDKIQTLKNQNIDIIICDHHIPGEILPAANAILDAKQKDCPYPFKELSGCGVGFKLACAYHTEILGKEISECYYLIDLVAVSICSDIVPIVGENRILTKYGLKNISDNFENLDANYTFKGLVKLYNGFNKKNLSVDDIVFNVGPKINAAGRMEHGKFAVELLLNKDEEEIKQKVIELSALNEDRKQVMNQTFEESVEQIKRKYADNIPESIVLKNKDWHKGIIGIVASKIVDLYNRPTLIFTYSQDKWVASGRSIQDFSFYTSLEECIDFFDSFGGHDHAAGLTLKKDKSIEEFESEFNKKVKSKITQESLISYIKYNFEVNLADISPSLFNTLKRFAPFGPENNRPYFRINGLVLDGDIKQLGSDYSHLSARLGKDNTSSYFTGFGFGKWYKYLKEGGKVDIVCALEYNGNGKSWEIKDMKTSEN